MSVESTSSVAWTLLGAFVFAAVLTPVCRAIARKRGIVAKPSGDRWHEHATALMGGVAIAFPVVIIGLVVLPIGDIWHLLVAGMLAAACGIADDLISLKASTKLIAQIAIASLLLFWGYRLEWTTSLIIDSMLTMVWIVGITNAFNLLDNMDGLCAGVAAISAAFLLLNVRESGDVTSLGMYLAALIGATCGFLVYNWHPASIFMGDAGSLFLGVNLAALPLLARSASGGGSRLLSVIIGPISLLAVPILDTTLVTAVRVLSGRAPSQGGRDHTSHRLVAVGLPQRSAVGILWTLAAAGGAISFLFTRGDVTWGLILVGCFLLGLVIFAVYLARVRVYEGTDFARVRDQRFTPLVVDVMYKRRIAEVILDVCLTTLAYYSAYRLRFEGSDLAPNYIYFIRSLPVVIACQLVALFVVGGYRGTWRLFGMMDSVIFVRGIIGGTLLSQLVVLYTDRYEHYSRSVFVVYAALLMLGITGTRASFRLIGEYVDRRRLAGRRCVIYGTGHASLATVREAFGDETPRILGFIDDNPLNRHMRVAGYSVLGTYNTLLTMISERQVDCVVLNTHLLDVEHLRAVEEACDENDVELLRLDIQLRPLSKIS